jgi:hypothetical protein
VLCIPSSASVVFGFAYIDYISTIIFFTANGNPGIRVSHHTYMVASAAEGMP